MMRGQSEKERDLLPWFVRGFQRLVTRKPIGLTHPLEDGIGAVSKSNEMQRMQSKPAVPRVRYKVYGEWLSLVSRLVVAVSFLGWLDAVQVRFGSEMRIEVDLIPGIQKAGL